MTEHLLTSDTSEPVVRPRPPLDRWMRDHDISDATGARRWGCSKQFVNGMRRHFDDPKRKRPGPDLLAIIVRDTNGAIRPGDFSPPVEAILRGMAA